MVKYGYLDSALNNIDLFPQQSRPSFFRGENDRSLDILGRLYECFLWL
jgi:hypothetical protein